MSRVLVVLVVLATLAPAARAGRGTNLVKYLPDDSTGVIVIDVAKARRSPFFQKGFEAVRSKFDELDKLASAVPVDKLIDTMVFAGNSDSTHVVAVFEGRVDKVLAAAKTDGAKQDTHDGVTFWSVADGEVAILDKRLVFSSPGEMTHVIDRAHDKKAKGPAAVRSVIGSMTASANAFGGGVFDADLKKQAAAELGAEPQWAAISLTLAAKLTMDARVKLPDEASAAKVAKSANDQLGTAGADGSIRARIEVMVGKGFSDSITVTQDHSLTKATAVMTTDELDHALTLAKMFM